MLSIALAIFQAISSFELIHFVKLCVESLPAEELSVTSREPDVPSPFDAE